MPPPESARPIAACGDSGREGADVAARRRSILFSSASITSGGQGSSALAATALVVIIQQPPCMPPASRSGAAGQHRTPRPVARPVRPPTGEALASGLILIGVAQHIEQFADARIVSLLGPVDRLLGEIVAQHIAGIDGIHART